MWRSPRLLFACVAFLGSGLLVPTARARPHPGPVAPRSGRPDATLLLPPDEALERQGAVIGEVVIRVGNVFDTDDPSEDNWLFRLANRLHAKTRPWVIREILLFRSGDPYSRRVLDESERLLREREEFYDAQIRPVAYDGRRVDVEVWVRDVWSITAGFGFGRAGGENRTHVKLQDLNLLGTGKSLTVERLSTVDRTTSLARYHDPNLAGTRLDLEAWYADRSDGSLRRFDLVRPFFSYEARWSAGIRSRSERRVDRLYFRGQVTDRFRHQQELAELSGGWSAGLVGRTTRRVTLGATYEEDRFAADPGGPVPVLLPRDRRLVYPWVGLEWVEEDFLETEDVDRIQRTEDLFLGGRRFIELGFSSTALGADRDRAVFEAGLRDGFRLGLGRFLIAIAQASGRWGGSGPENLVVGARGRFYWRDFGRHLVLADLALDFARNLDRDNQLLLGGDNGLRGYPLRYQEGDRRFLLTLEQRFYTGWDLLHLVNVGAAVFIDVGRSWYPGRSRDPGSGVLRDVGFGLRLASSRSGGDAMVHVDLAFPLDGGSSIDRVQWLVTTRETF